MADMNYISGEDMTIADFLYGCVNFYVPEEAVGTILARLGIDSDQLYVDLEPEMQKKCEAKLYEWIATSPSRIGDVSDSDNGWKHSQGGFSFTDADRRYYLGLANAIYEELGMEPVGKTKFKMNSHGISRANLTFGGDPLPHIVK